MKPSVLAFCFMLFLFSCEEKKKELSEKQKIETDSILMRNSLNGKSIKPQEVTTNYDIDKLFKWERKTVYSRSDSFKDLSYVFDFYVTCKRLEIGNPPERITWDISIKEKSTGKRRQFLHIDNEYNFYTPLKKGHYTASYITNKNNVHPMLEGGYGDFIVADFNFDKRDDFAIVLAQPLSSCGLFYSYYIQDTNGKFYRSPFLEDHLICFPTEFDSTKKQLTDYSPSGTFAVDKVIVQFDSATRKWAQVDSAYMYLTEFYKKFPAERNKHLSPY